MLGIDDDLSCPGKTVAFLACCERILALEAFRRRSCSRWASLESSHQSLFSGRFICGNLEEVAAFGWVRVVRAELAVETGFALPFSGENTKRRSVDGLETGSSLEALLSSRVFLAALSLFLAFFGLKAGLVGAFGGARFLLLRFWESLLSFSPPLTAAFV